MRIPVSRVVKVHVRQDCPILCLNTLQLFADFVGRIAGELDFDLGKRLGQFDEHRR